MQLDLLGPLAIASLDRIVISVWRDIPFRKMYKLRMPPLMVDPDITPTNFPIDLSVPPVASRALITFNRAARTEEVDRLVAAASGARHSQVDVVLALAVSDTVPERPVLALRPRREHAGRVWGLCLTSGFGTRKLYTTFADPHWVTPAEYGFLVEWDGETCPF